ncbi:MAG TPA: NAD+ synthase [Candidatus Altiarchaeales archaeon]|nr:NAD+ synthase [Candidatus Altiarchaeales archaeon]
MKMNELNLTEEQMKKLRKKIEKSIMDILKRSKTKGVVVGISGGIDSSVVLKLVNVVDTYALIMPEMGLTKNSDVEDAKNLADDLGVKYNIIEINPVIDSIEKIFPWHNFSDENRGMVIGNVMARTRMILLYLVANIDRRIVLGTGNKTEILLGYTTKYGDAACDILPIGDLYKTQVRQFAEFLGISKRIMKKRPSAGLWKGQTDEDELGASYEDIDRILHLLIDKDYTIEKTADELSLPVELIENINSRVERNKHKRVMPKAVKLS